MYNLPEVFRIEGNLDVSALDRCFNEIVRRHECLRTTFAGERLGPVQVVHPCADFHLRYEDLQGSEGEADSAWRLISERARRPFDLSRGPLFRADLFRLGEREYVLLVNMHHIVSDGWSLGVLHRELGSLYGAFPRGEASSLGELPIQYADYAVWQQERLTGKDLQQELGYWKRKLSGASGVLAMPTDRPRPPVPSYQGAKVAVRLPESVSDGVRRLARDKDATTFMVLMAAFQTLLHRHTQQPDLLVGTPIANRDRVETEGLIGFFVNTLVLRTDLSGDPTFRELVGRVRCVALEAFAHSELSFEKLVQELSRPRQMSRAPLFQALFGLRSPLEALRLEGLSVSRLELDSETAKFDLTLILDDAGPEISGWLQYSTDLFEGATAKRLVEQLQRLLEAAVADPDQQLSRLPLMSDAERRRVTVDWNETAVSYPRDASIHELFERQVERSPDAVALVCGDQRLTFRQLNETANRVARQLRALGAGPEAIVGICLDRSVEMIAALLGVLKAGGAYLPLDPSFPTGWLDRMLHETGASIVITRESHRERLPSTAPPVVSLDRDVAQIAGRSDENLETVSGPDNLAYVMYTSGSTGQPKGVMVPHRAVVRLLFGTDYARLDEATVLLHQAPVSFDASTFEIWGGLLHGGRCVASPEGAREPERLRALVRSEGVTTAWMTGSLFHAVADLDVSVLKGLSELLIGGEVLSVPHVRRALEQLHPTRLINGYGPTESTTFACCHRIHGVDLGRPTIPIGRPIANTRAYILDSRGAAAAPGVRGELYIGGDGLARGYWGRPDVTAERFLPDPFSAGGGRLYRTGDFARFLADGSIEFLGRADHQVKVRGFRIEIEEVEAALGQAPGVRQAAVSCEEDGHGSRRLIAYLSASRPAPASADIRSFLGTRLPDYMIPSRFVFRDELPLTASGKVDRTALDAASAVEGPELSELEAPRSWVEDVIAGIWAETLGLSRFGRLQSFFELGGHSLLATSVIGRLRKAFDVEIGVRQLFETPTIAGLASAVETAWGAPGSPPLRPATGELPVTAPLSFGQERLWFLDRLNPGRSEYNVFGALRLEGALDGEALRRSVEEIVRRHETLRTRFTEIDGKPLQDVAPAGRWKLPLRDLTGLPLQERETASRRLARSEALVPFDLAEGAPFRACLIRLDDADHVFVWAMHHAVSDGWSLGVFQRELAVCYPAFAAGSSPSLAELPIQYRDYAVWQRDWLRGEALEAQLSYWRGQLAESERLRLPVDRDRPALRSGRGSRVRFRLSAELSRRLSELSRAQGVTMFMTLLAAFQTLLYRTTGQEDILLGTDIANRRPVEVEGLIGFFANLLALRTKLTGNPPFLELLERVRETAVGAYAHQDLPFARLVTALRPERSLAYNPLLQALFVQNAPLPAPAIPGLVVRSLPIFSGLSKFDLAVFVEDGPDGIRGSWRFNTDLFLPSTMRRLTGRFEQLLESIASDPTRPLRQLAIEEAPAETPAGGQLERKSIIRSAHRKGIKIPQ